MHLENQLKNSHSQVEQLINPELEKIKEIIKQHDKEEAQFSEELRTLAGTVKEREKDLEKKEKESKKARKQEGKSARLNWESGRLKLSKVLFFVLVTAASNGAQPPAAAPPAPQADLGQGAGRKETQVLSE